MHIVTTPLLPSSVCGPGGPQTELGYIFQPKCIF